VLGGGLSSRSKMPITEIVKVKSSRVDTQKKIEIVLTPVNRNYL
jgi:hypothetical protein